jgi:ribosomal protein S19
MSESIEELISRSLQEGINVDDSCELTKVIDRENDSLNVLKGIKTHLDSQGILPMLFQIQKEIYTQT